MHGTAPLRILVSRIVGGLSALALIGLAGAWCAASLVAILNFGLRYPAFDQYHFYPTYLALPFPDVLFQLENGHRPVLPALVRWLEVEIGGAGQMLQVGVGIAFVLATVALIGLAAWRDRQSALHGATGWLLVALGVLWLGNARMLIHSNEILAIYMVTAFGIAGLWAVFEATRGHAARWMGVAGLCALAAVFSFGSGMAAFAALFACAFAARVAWRAWIPAVLLFAASVLMYVAGMPGDSGVRNSLTMAPLDNLVVGLRWLSAPWMHAWLGSAEPAVYPWLVQQAPVNAVEEWMRSTAGGLGDALGARAPFIESVTIGSLGLFGWGFCLWHLRSRRHAVTRSQVVSFGVATFGLAVGAIICLARVAHFESHPQDLFAERYLPWSSLFWLGLALYTLAARTTPSAWRDMAGAALACALLAVLYPSHQVWAGWSAAVHRSNQASAVAAQMGIWDPQRFPDGLDARKADVLETLGMLRERHLSMFGEPGFVLWDSAWTVSASEPVSAEKAWFRVQSAFEDDTGRVVGRFEGVLPEGIPSPGDGVLVVVDASNVRRGMAKMSFLGFDDDALRFDRATPRGFDGYLIAPQPGELFDLLILEPGSGGITARLPLRE